MRPPPPAAKVTFGAPRTKLKIDPKGLETLPVGVLSALYKRLSEEGVCESEVADRLTKEYGGGLMGNARAVRSLMDAADDIEFEKPNRRLGNIDLASTDRESPPPYSAPSPELGAWG